MAWSIKRGTSLERGARRSPIGAAPDLAVHSVLEEEMVKLIDARGDYDTAVGFYQKSLDMLKLAIRKPGGGI